MIFDKKEKYLNGDGLFEVFKLGFIGEDAPRGTFGKVPLGTPQNFLGKVLSPSKGGVH
jgi:hypothetical protein